MKKINYFKLLKLFIALGLIISTMFTSFSKAAGPKVLENYKAYHDTVYAQKIESEKYNNSDIQIVENFLKTAVNECDFSMNTHVSLVENIIKEDTIKSSVERLWDLHKDCEYSEKYLSRRHSTPEFFHVDINKLEGKDYERYGYLTCKDKNSEDFKIGAKNVSEWYGNVIMNFKKSNLIYRTTLTIGDSLNNRHKLGKNSITPTMVNGPKIVCVPGYSKELVGLLANCISEGTLLPQYPGSLDKIKYNELSLDYFELQFHGELSFKNDVESVDIIRTSGQNEDDKKEQERIANKIRNLGIPVNIIDCSK